MLVKFKNSLSEFISENIELDKNNSVLLELKYKSPIIYKNPTISTSRIARFVDYSIDDIFNDSSSVYYSASGIPPLYGSTYECYGTTYEMGPKFTYSFSPHPYSNSSYCFEYNLSHWSFCFFVYDGFLDKSTVTEGIIHGYRYNGDSSLSKQFAFKRSSTRGFSLYLHDDNINIAENITVGNNLGSDSHTLWFENNYYKENEFNFLAATFDGKYIRFYCNGHLVGECIYEGDWTIDSVNNHYTACSNDLDRKYAYQQYRAFSRGLTPEEVDYLYNIPDVGYSLDLDMIFNTRCLLIFEDGTFKEERISLEKNGDIYELENTFDKDIKGFIPLESFRQQSILDVSRTSIFFRLHKNDVFDKPQRVIFMKSDGSRVSANVKSFEYNFSYNSSSSWGSDLYADIDLIDNFSGLSGDLNSIDKSGYFSTCYHHRPFTYNLSDSYNNYVCYFWVKPIIISSNTVFDAGNLQSVSINEKYLTGYGKESSITNNKWNFCIIYSSSDPEHCHAIVNFGDVKSESNWSYYSGGISSFDLYLFGHYLKKIKVGNLIRNVESLIRNEYLNETFLVKIDLDNELNLSFSEIDRCILVYDFISVRHSSHPFLGEDLSSYLLKLEDTEMELGFFSSNNLLNLQTVTTFDGNTSKIFEKEIEFVDNENKDYIPNLVNWIKFDGNLDDSITGTTYSGTDVTFNSGHFGQSVELNGTSSYVDLNNLGTSYDNFTIFMYFKPYKVDETQILLQDLNDSNDKTFKVIIEDLSVKVFIGDGNSVNGTSVNFNPFYQGFYPLVITYDSNYLNIIVQDISRMANLNTTTHSSNTIALRVGSSINGDLYFSGLVDDIRIFNRSLSIYEIKKLLNFGKYIYRYKFENPIDKTKGIYVNKGDSLDSMITSIDFKNNIITYRSQYNATNNFQFRIRSSVGCEEIYSIKLGLGGD